MITSTKSERDEAKQIQTTVPRHRLARRGRVWGVVAFGPIALLAACGAPARTASAPAASTSDGDYGYSFDVDSPKNAAASPASDLSLPHAAGDRVPPETVQAIVRSHYAAVGSCYAAGLARQPSLSGTVTVKVTAGADGDTRRAEDDGSTLADKEVVACVVGAFGKIRYPRGGGVITVQYPIALAP